MLRNLKDIEGFAIGATDGAIGEVRDFYFDDEAWVVRYFVVETGTWHANRRVLVSPMAVGEPLWLERLLPVSITQVQVRNAPDIDTDKPVSRQHEMGYLGYYGYPAYWGGGGLWGAGLYPDVLQAGFGVNEPGRGNQRARSLRRRPDDLHLRSVNTVLRYYVQASDGDIGHVEGILVEERSWAIRYLVVNTSNWWLGHQVLIAPEWIEEFLWAESKMVVSITRQALKDAPAYDAKAPPTREQEQIMHDYHGHRGYWPSETLAPPP